MRLLGLDPGLRHTGWGVVEARHGRISHIANGVVHSDDRLPLAGRLCQLFDGLVRVVESFGPDEAAVEETFGNRNQGSTLKLGQARGVVLLAPARAGLPVSEYAANRVKKAVVGVGHADKRQIAAMVAALLPGVAIEGPDAADALAVAICHAHYRETRTRLGPAAAVGLGRGGAQS